MGYGIIIEGSKVKNITITELRINITDSQFSASILLIKVSSLVGTMLVVTD